MIMDTQNPIEAMLIQALATLTPPQFTDLTYTISSLFHGHRRRLFSLLSSPTLFSLTLHYLHSLSLHRKSLLIAKYLLSNLSTLTHFFKSKSMATPPSPPYAATSMKLRDLDAVLLVLLLCELRQHDDKVLDNTSPLHWHGVLCQFVSDIMLRISAGMGVSSCEVLIEYVKEVAKCKNFVDTLCCGGGKEGKEVAASVAVVVALPSVKVSNGGKECVICKEEMVVGRDVCEMPCEHLFHWMCILPWLQKRNTCPCCRYQLPTEDVISEIQRLWKILTTISQECFDEEYS